VSAAAATADAVYCRCTVTCVVNDNVMVNTSMHQIGVIVVVRKVVNLHRAGAKPSEQEAKLSLG